MAINANVLRRPSDRGIFIAAAIAFPVLVLLGYARTYYLRGLFDGPPLATSLVHFHGIVMSAWVLYFVAQVALVRTKNLKLHMTLGFAGIGLAVLVVVVGMATAWDAHIVRNTAPPGLDPHEFFLVPVTDLALFVLYLGGAIYYRKKPMEHKGLMLLTMFNFLPAAVARIPLLPPEYVVLQGFVIPYAAAILTFAWQTYRHRRFSWPVAAGTALLAMSLPFRIWFGSTDIWHGLTNWLAG